MQPRTSAGRFGCMTSICIRARRGLLLAAASLPLLGGATAAHATTVTSDGTTIRITETVPGEANAVLLSMSGDGRVDVGDTTSGIHAGGRCAYDDVIDGALCPLGPGGVIVTTGAGDDSVGDLSLS